MNTLLHDITNSYLDGRGECLKPAEQLVGVGGCAHVSAGLGDLLCHVTHVVKLLSTCLHGIFQLLWNDKKVSKCAGCSEKPDLPLFSFVVVGGGVFFCI